MQPMVEALGLDIHQVRKAIRSAFTQFYTLCGKLLCMLGLGFDMAHPAYLVGLPLPIAQKR